MGQAGRLGRTIRPVRFGGLRDARRMGASAKASGACGRARRGFAGGSSVSGTLLPPCNARFEPQDANRLWHIGSHIWSTI